MKTCYCGTRHKAVRDSKLSFLVHHDFAFQVFAFFFHWMHQYWVQIYKQISSTLSTDKSNTNFFSVMADYSLRIMNYHDSDIMVHWKVKRKGYQSMFLFTVHFWILGWYLEWDRMENKLVPKGYLSFSSIFQSMIWNLCDRKGNEILKSERKV